MKILVIGSINKDYTYTVDHIAAPGETISSTDFEIFWGGKGFNQSIALAKAGADVTFACNIAKEDYPEVRKLFQNYGIHDAYLFQQGAVTGHAMIQIDASGQNSIVLYPGANHEMQEAWLEQILSSFHAGDMLLLQNEINQMAPIITAAKQKGLIIALNPSPITKELLAYPLEQVDIFIVNEEEGKFFTNLDMPGKDMAQKMAGMYPKAKIVLTLGEKGAVLAEGDFLYEQEACPVEAIDTTGAGDTFTGYFLNGIARNESIQQMLKTAARAAAIAVTQKGAANAIPSRVDVLKWY